MTEEQITIAIETLNGKIEANTKVLCVFANAIKDANEQTASELAQQLENERITGQRLIYNTEAGAAHNKVLDAVASSLKPS
ncbi:MAG: hypothetical protein OXB98_06640 [Bryobacterales bacterium]|nr:hypothetical protein [Bryobacterales bacterium]